jgi:hypothetical protein
LAASAVLAMASPAASTVWKLYDDEMSGGTSLNGTFTTDPVSGELETYDITVNGGPYGEGGGYLFSSTLSEDYIRSHGPMLFQVSNYGGNTISLMLDDSLAGRLTASDLGYSYFDCPACGGSYDVSGSSGFVAVPEPAAWATMILGLGLTGGGLRLARARRAIAAPWRLSPRP